MDTNTKRLHPLLTLAAVSVTLFSAVGVAAITGLIPHSKGQMNEPTPVAAAEAPAPQAQTMPAPAPEVSPAPQPAKKHVAKPHKAPQQVAYADVPATTPPPPPTPLPTAIATVVQQVVAVPTTVSSPAGLATGLPR